MHDYEQRMQILRQYTRSQASPKVSSRWVTQYAISPAPITLLKEIRILTK